MEVIFNRDAPAGQRSVRGGSGRGRGGGGNRRGKRHQNDQGPSRPPPRERETWDELDSEMDVDDGADEKTSAPQRPQHQQNSERGGRGRGGHQQNRPRSGQDRNSPRMPQQQQQYQQNGSGNQQGQRQGSGRPRQQQQQQQQQQPQRQQQHQQQGQHQQQNQHQHQQQQQQRHERSNGRSQQQQSHHESRDEMEVDDVKIADDAPKGTAGSGIDQSFLSDRKFSEPAIANLLSVPTKRALTEVFGFDRLSLVQAASLPLLREGSDCFAKAKTGGGKTLAFLIPAVERLIEALDGRRPPFHYVGILVISPTRELALQILAEAKQLIRFHNGMRADAVIGGTNINGERQRLTLRGKVGMDILVGTPGRLVDHLESTPGFADALRVVRVLVLDEADRLLDMGFKPALDRIHDALPPGVDRDGKLIRQTLLFSATVPEEVKSVAHRFLRKGYPLVDTVGEDQQQTNAQVKQEVLVVPGTSVVPALARVLSHVARTDKNHKVLVFFAAARLTGFVAELFKRMKIEGAPADGRGGPHFNIIEMHSRKSQSYRTAASERFRTGKGVIMMSSDVTARGMDYPDISLVVQIGLTDKEQYIHRVGRTARAGKSGAGLLLLADYEAPALLPLLYEAKVPLEPSGPNSDITGGAANGLPGVDHVTGSGRQTKVPVSPAVPPSREYQTVIASVQRDDELFKAINQAYAGTLGFYNSNVSRMKWDKVRLVAAMNELFLSLGCGEVPMMSAKALGKMQLRGVKGIREAPKNWRPSDGYDD